MESPGSQPTLSQAEAFARIRLLRSPNIGPVSYRQLIARFGTAATALDALPDLASRGRGPYRPAKAETIEREVAAVRRAGARYLFHDQPDYPALLAELDSAPPIVTCRGKLALASTPCVALVGARNASAAAVKLARDFGAALAEAGFTVVSGLARGIDGAAHKGAFPRTIGVIASGIDITYPPQHEALQERIASQGLLIAEQPPGTEPRGRHFPSRNRIIAGLALGTLVIEAAPQSGSLITARPAATN
jgi:DNA processing protein